MSDLENEFREALVDRQGGVVPAMSLDDFRTAIAAAMDAAPSLPPSAKLAIFADMLGRFKIELSSKLNPKYYGLVLHRMRQQLGLDPITDPKVAAVEYRISLDYHYRRHPTVERAFLAGANGDELESLENDSDGKHDAAHAAGRAFTESLKPRDVEPE